MDAAGRQPSGPRQRGLRTKIMLWFLLPTALILGVVAALAYSTVQRGTTELVFARSEDRARLLAGQLSGELATYRQVLSLAAAEVSESGLPADTLVAWPGGLLSPFDGGAVVLDRDGAVQTATSGLEPLVGTRQPGLAAVVLWDQRFGPDRGLGYSNVLFAIDNRLDVVAVGTTLYEPVDPASSAAELALVGLFRVEQQAVRTSTLYDRVWQLYIGRMTAPGSAAPSESLALSSQRIPQPELAYLVDAEGIVIFHPDTFMIGSDFSGRRAVSGLLDGQLGPLRTENPGGQEVVAAAAQVPRTPWYLVTETSWELVTQSARATTRLLLLLLGLAVLLPVLIVTAAAGRITRPLARLTEAARTIAGGRFDQRIELDTGDELEVLADQFNAMSAELEASYATLEQRVADRTRELAALNAVAAAASRSLDMEGVLGDALAETLAATGLQAGAAFRREGDGLRLKAHRGLSSTFVTAVRELPIADEGVAGSVGEELDTMPDLRGSAAGAAMASGTLVSREVTDYAQGRLRRLLMAEGAKTVISVPLKARDRVVGVINLVGRARVHAAPLGSSVFGEEAVARQTRSDPALTEEMAALLTAIGEQVGVAVENATLYEQVEEAAATAERHRLARDLHDAISQTLFTASLIADTLPRLWDRDPVEARHQLATLRRLTNGAQAEMRTLLLELRPAALVETDLEVLLGHLGRAVAARADVEVDMDLTPVGPIPTDAKIGLYRIAQEALNNVIKHAAASRVAISLQREGGEGEEAPSALVLKIDDDGRGFDADGVPPDHFGLQTMRERAEALGATLTITSRLGDGTAVVVRMRQ